MAARVERCATCNGAIMGVALSDAYVPPEGPDAYAVRDAARHGRFIAEPMTSIHDIAQDQRGHRAYCAEKGRGLT